MQKYLIALFLFVSISVFAQKYETKSGASYNFSPNSFDLEDYSKIPVKKVLNNCFDASYKYYFEVNGQKFRIVHKQDTIFPQEAILQKLVYKKWQNRLAFYKYNHYYGIKLKDVNNDGYIDILRKSRWFDEIYLYKPTINNFVDSVCGELFSNSYLIDTLHNIYCDFFEGKLLCYNINSTLYTYRDFHKYSLYKLDLYNCESEMHEKVTKLIISKAINGNDDNLYKIKTINLKKAIFISDKKYFDYIKFWRKRYRKLLGYS